MMFVNRDNYTMYLRLWLIILFILIILMVAVGGLTRLTDSGLSITAWELFTGIFPPINQIEWNNYFSEYKKIPEYRIVGLFSLLPLVFFTLRFRKSNFYSNKYYLIFLLVCLQGFIGWYMVSSGLVENNDVSHFRLSIHLSLALFLLSLIFWYLLDISIVNKFKIKFKHDTIPEDLERRFLSSNVVKSYKSIL